MMRSDVGLLAIDSARTRAYLRAMLANALLPGQAILLADGSAADGTSSTLDLVQRADIPHVILRTSDVNSAEVIEAVRKSPARVFVYSGPPGTILHRAMLSSGKQFLHIHPGIVPEFRGSTTLYYSLLREGTCGASALWLNERIDGGPVIATRAYPAPLDRSTMDDEYDPCIRADLLVQVLKRYQADGGLPAFPQSETGGETYHIVHPVLKHIAILAGSG